jgi:nucleotide-binding universal stress UspA family protein
MPRLAHLLVGGTATAAAHVLPASVLVARRPPAGAQFGDRIVVASDALERSSELVGLATALARLHGSSLTLVHAIDGPSSRHPTRLGAQVDFVTRTLGEKAHVRIEPRHVHDLILEAATTDLCSLLILGSRRVGGVRAVGSVSERMVHDAPCSVLVIRPEDLLDGVALA